MLSKRMVLGMALAGVSHAGELFDGKTLNGWEGDPALWRVENGAIVGETNGTDKKLKANDFLIWSGGEVGDFELTFKAKATGNNSGFQYRSQRIPGEGWRLKGYQMDLHPKAEFLGMLYEEKGRGIACQRGQRVKLAAGSKPEEIAKLAIEPTNLGEWNEYRIVAEGHRLQHFVNGRLAAHITDLDEEKRSMRGLLGIQLHAGPAMRVEVKDIVLNTQPEATANPRGPVVSWIWSAERAKAGEQVYFRREFKAPDDVEAAELVVTADDHARVWVNGVDLGESEEVSKVASHDIRKHLVKGGMNVIAVAARNKEGAAGVALRLHMTLGDGSKRFVVSNGEWLFAREVEQGWQMPVHVGTRWNSVTVVGKMGDEPWGAVIPEPATGGS